MDAKKSIEKANLLWLLTLSRGTCRPQIHQKIQNQSRFLATVIHSGENVGSDLAPSDLPLKFHPLATRAPAVLNTPSGAV